MTVPLCALLAAAAVLLLLSPRSGAPSRAGAGPRAGPVDLPAPSPPRSRTAGATTHLRAAAVLGTGAAVLLLVPGVEGVLATAAACIVVAWRSGRWEGASERRRRAAVEAEVPLVVDLLVAALCAGSGPSEALERVAEVVGGATRDELQVPLARLRLGADPVAVWTSLGGHPQLHRLGRTLARAAESGAPVAEALQRLASDLRDRHRAEVEARVRQVEVKAAAPLGVCLLPAFVLLGVVPLVAGAAVHLVGR